MQDLVLASGSVEDLTEDCMGPLLFDENGNPQAGVSMTSSGVNSGYNQPSVGLYLYAQTLCWRHLDDGSQGWVEVSYRGNH